MLQNPFKTAIPPESEKKDNSILALHMLYNIISVPVTGVNKS
jgi:hypothetical protein